MKSFKGYVLTEASGVKAEDYEASIVIGWYKLHNKPLPPNNAGIADKVLKNVRANENVLVAGDKIAKNVLKVFPELKGEDAEQYGRAEASITSFWSWHGATDTTPKTDVLIGNKRFSVKIDIAQLMSGGREETLATYYGALENSSKEITKDPQFSKVTAIIESFVKGSLAPSKLRPIIKSKENPIVNDAEAAHKACMAELGTLFEGNKKFKIEFAREAMSGNMKFGKSSNAAAEWMLVSSKNGSKVQIHNVGDDSYCENIANKLKLQARFKTSGRVLSAFKSKSNPKGKTWEYHFWSVVSLIVDAFVEAYEPYDGKVLTEGIIDTIKSKVSGFFSKVWNKVKKVYKRTTSSMIEFLQAVPTIIVKKRIKF